MEVLEKRIPKILSRISDVTDFRRIASEALKGENDVVVSGLPGSARALFIAGLWQTMRRPIVVVTSNDSAVAGLATDTEYFHTMLSGTANRVCQLPAWETDPYAGLSPHADIQQARATTLWRLRHRQADIVVTSVRSICTRLIAPEQFETYSVHISSGDELSQELLAEHLVSAGYLRQESVGAPGEFSVRGGIVDIFSPLMRSPTRIEFFGDSVDSLREFDLDDQRSRGPVQHIDVLPMQEAVFSREMLRQWGQDARGRWADDLFSKDLSEKLVFADNGELFPGAQFLLPLSNPLQSTIFEYADPCVFVLDEAETLQELHQKFFSILESRHVQASTAGVVAVPPAELFLRPEDLEQRLSAHRGISLEETGAGASQSSVHFSVSAQPAPKWHGRIKELAEDVRNAYAGDTQVVLLGSTLGMAERLRDLLHEYDIPFRLEFGEQPLRVVEEPSVPIV